MAFTRDYERPLYWQDFEDLTQGMFRTVYGDLDAQKNGRIGQAQSGVDVYGKNKESELIGIQCKRLDEVGPGGETLPGGVLTSTIIATEIKNAESFEPKLTMFIIATTAKNDNAIQREIRLIDNTRRSQGKFSVGVWFWDFYNGWINNDAGLQKWYYNDVLQTRMPETTDRYILETFHMAFSRNAFRDLIGREEPQPFLKAIEDTQRALSTGELRDRETKAVIRKAPGGISAITNKDWLRELQLVKKEVDRVRDVYRNARESKAPGLIEHEFRVEILDPQVETELNHGRATAIRILNGVLLEASLPQVDSPLIVQP
jgi:hypothetical protein